MDAMKPDSLGSAVVPVLACVLEQLCARNDRLQTKTVSKFHALRSPGITLHEYLRRIYKYTACSGECFVLALIYIDKIIQANPTFVIGHLNIHRLLITAIMLAAKFFDDQYFNNAYYAKVGGVPCNEMNALEADFLFYIGFSLQQHVPPLVLVSPPSPYAAQFMTTEQIDDVNAEQVSLIPEQAVQQPVQHPSQPQLGAQLAQQYMPPPTHPQAASHGGSIITTTSVQVYPQQLYVGGGGQYVAPPNITQQHLTNPTVYKQHPGDEQQYTYGQGGLVGHTEPQHW